MSKGKLANKSQNVAKVRFFFDSGNFSAKKTCYICNYCKIYGVMKRFFVCFVLCVSLLRPFAARSASFGSDFRTGAERIGDYLPLLEGRRVALVANQTSVLRSSNGGYVHLVDSLLSLGVDIVFIFSPEHGFRGDVEAGGKVNSGVDAKTGLSVISLYGSNKKPSVEQMEKCDVVLFDLQDVGCRFYTYISTLHYVMEACAASKRELILLDRPNPNDYVDGPVLDTAFSSFVGMHPVPVVHGMTVGEYARMINGEHWLEGGVQCDLRVVEMKGWKHGMDEVYTLPVAPSPNLRTSEAIALYPSLCFFEGTLVSVGRGTDTPFEIIGYPQYWDKAFGFVPRSIKGVSDNPPYKGKKCYGLKDLKTRKGELDLTYLLKMYAECKDKKAFFNSFFDKLAGGDLLRRQIVALWDEQRIRLSWQEGLEAYKKIRTKYLLYE